MSRKYLNFYILYLTKGLFFKKKKERKEQPNLDVIYSKVSMFSGCFGSASICPEMSCDGGR